MRLLLVATLLGALGCASPAFSQTTNAQTSEPQSIWKKLDASGVQHLQTGLVCPGTLLSHKRLPAVFYEPHGLDVSCAYNTSGGAITVYLTYRHEPDLAAEMMEAKRQMQGGAVGAGNPKLTVEDNPATGGMGWRRAAYSLDGGMETEIWLAQLERWVLKVRATYPSREKTEVMALIAAMTDQVRTTAQPTLTACAKSKEPKRTGARITDRKTLEKASMAGGVLGGLLQSTLKKGDAHPLFWCPEGGFDTKNVPLLYWRAAHVDGRDGEMDQVSAMSNVPPPTLLAAPDINLAAMVAGADAKPSQWVATYESGGQTWIYAYFDARPKPKDLTGLLFDIIDGKAKPLIGYSANGGNANIVLPSDRR
jgi:hypothetical protein